MTNGIRAPRVPSEALCSRNLKVMVAPQAELWNAEIVIGISLHNQARSLPAALRSAVGQTAVVNQRAVILVLDDGSTDDWQSAIKEYLDHPQVVAVKGNCGSPARARNALLDFVDEHFPCAKWVARLDADDVFAHPDAISTLCDQGEMTKANYILGSNHLAQDGMLLPWSNIANPDELKNPRKLLDLIESFALRGRERELPSCNLVLRVHSGIRYPGIRGAEDHWLVASLLIFEPSHGTIVPYPVYSTYTLNGTESISNQKSDQWSVQRRRLAEAARIWTKALQAGEEVLGVGQEGIVWRNHGTVWKEFYPWAMSKDDQSKLEATLANAPDCIPTPAWETTSVGRVRCRYQCKIRSTLDTHSDLNRTPIPELTGQCFRF